MAHWILNLKQEELNNQQFENIFKYPITYIVAYREDKYYIVYVPSGNKYESCNINHNFFMNLIYKYNIDSKIIKYKVRKHEDCQCIVL